MKKTKLFGLAFVVTMLGTSMSSCSNEAEEVLLQDSEIKLTSEIIPSRVTSLDYQSTQIVEGQQVGVTITGAKTEHKNIAWTVGADGRLTNTGSPVYWSNTQATITAYHPYNSSWTGTNHSFSVSTDQSDEADYRNSDLLWVTQTGTKTDETVALTFAHKLAKVNVTLTSEDITDLSGATISICGTDITTDFNPDNGELFNLSNTQDIIAGTTTADAFTASAIIIPQTLDNGTQLIKVSHNNSNYFYTLSADKTFESSHSYSYTLKINGKSVEVEVESDNITDWDDEEIEGDMNKDVTAMKITLSSAGTLNQYITSEAINKITSLTISGEINGDDVRLFRSMSNLNYLNLESATIIEGGSNFLDYGDSFDGFTYPNNVGGVGRWITEDIYTKKSSINYMFIGMKQLTEIILPSNLEYIGSHAFYGCTKLKTITLPQSVDFERGYLDCDSFYACSSLEAINVEEGNANMKSEDGCLIMISNGMESLAAVPCAKKEFEIPSNIKEIFSYTFPEDCRIETLTISSESLQLNPYYFGHFLYLKNIYVKNSIPYTSLDGVLYSKDNKTIICYPSGRESLTYEINKSVTAIGTGCFNGSVYLETMNLPEGIETIGGSSFFDCRKLEEITLPSTLKEIESAAFQHCYNLKKVICKATTPPVIPDNYVFLMDELKNTELYVPAKSFNLYKSTDYWKEFGDNIKVIEN